MGEKDDFTPPEGFPGNLTDEQEKKLKEMWTLALKLKEDKTEIAGVKADSKVGKESEGDAPDEDAGEDAFKDTAKDDAGKDKQAQEAEKKALAGLLGEYGPAAFRKELWQSARGEEPDATMLRFLRARKWDVERAFGMLAGSIKWRIEQGVQEIKEKGEEGMCEEDGFRMQYDIGKSYVHGTDAKDRPVIFIHVAKHHPKDQSQKSLQRFVIYSMELSKGLLTPRSLGQGTLVFDLTNFGLSNMDWSCVKFILECFEKYYPETLGNCLVHKAPMVFSAIWAILRPLLDPVVREKIHFTKSAADLAKFIPENHIEKSMGGDEDWEWTYDGPEKGENKIQEDKSAKEEKLKLYNDACEEFEDLTQKWINGDSGAKEQREKQAKIIMIRHYDLDPYVRGKSVYHRKGIYRGNGQVRWTYEGEPEVFGTDFNAVRKELQIEGECPKYGSDTAEPGAAAAEKAARIDPDKEARIAAGKAKKHPGEGLPPVLVRRASHGASKLTPGPSNAEKAREEAEKLKAELEGTAEKEKKEAEEEERKRKAEKEERKRQAEKEAEEAKKGVLNTVKNTVAPVTGAAAGILTSSLHTVSAIVPTAIGGQKLADLTAPAKQEENQENVEKEVAEKAEEAE